MKKKLLISVFIMQVILCAGLFSEKLQAQQKEPVKNIFEIIEKGISQGNVDYFSDYLDSKIFLSLSGGNPGYYSKNQAYYMLKDYFSVYKTIGFHFLNDDSKSSAPYASGSIKYFSRGIRGTAQIYVGLKMSGGLWKITQITIDR